MTQCHIPSYHILHYWYVCKPYDIISLCPQTIWHNIPVSLNYMTQYPYVNLMWYSMSSNQLTHYPHILKQFDTIYHVLKHLTKYCHILKSCDTISHVVNLLDTILPCPQLICCNIHMSSNHLTQYPQVIIPTDTTDNLSETILSCPSIHSDDKHNNARMFLFIISLIHL